jgi:LmbE family N-acetylglucosaminyl deacetylase
MVVMAHPDDPEFLAGGTIAKLAREGREITYVIVTNGNKGSDDPAVTSERLASTAPKCSRLSGPTDALACTVKPTRMRDRGSW